MDMAQLLEDFQRLSSEGEWEEALPIIKQILKANPEISTSWFNYGACLHNLERFNEAADAYIMAFECDRENGGALYRGCLAYAQAGNSDRLFEIMSIICSGNPSMLPNFVNEPAFQEFMSEPRYQDLIRRLQGHG